MDETTQRTRNPWGQGDRLRLEILEAADRLLSELGGVQALTIRGIARAAGIAPASIYQHFADKDALVKGLAEYHHVLLATLMREADASCDPEDVMGRLKAQMHAYSRFVFDNPGHYRLIANNRRKQLAEGVEPPVASILQEVIVALERCERAGHRLRLPRERAAVMLFVGVHGRVAISRTIPAADAAEQLAAFVDDLLFVVFA